MHPKRAALVGLVFPLIAVLYVVATAALSGTIDWAGFTMLIALGLAMSLMAYVLFAGLAKS
jgi:hypothetical protein